MSSAAVMFLAGSQELAVSTFMGLDIQWACPCFCRVTTQCVCAALSCEIELKAPGSLGERLQTLSVHWLEIGNTRPIPCCMFGCAALV